MEYCEKVIQIYPNICYGYYVKGIILLNSELYRESLELFDRSISMNQTHSHFYLSRAFVKLILGDYESTAADLQTALTKTQDISETFTAFYREGI